MVTNFTNKVMRPVLVDQANELPLLRARAIACLPNVAPFLSEDNQKPLAQSVVAGLAQSNPLPVRLAGVRALYALLIDQSPTMKAVLVPQVLVSHALAPVADLCGLMTGDALMLCVETFMQIIVQCPPGLVVQMESKVTGMLIRIWQRFSHEREISLHVREAVRRLAKIPEALAGLQQHALPAAVAALQSSLSHAAAAGDDASGARSDALVMQTALMMIIDIAQLALLHQSQGIAVPLHPLLAEVVVPLVTDTALRSSNSDIVDLATLALTSFLLLLKQRAAPSPQSLDTLLSVVRRQLDPASPLGGHAGANAGSLVAQLVIVCGAQLGAAGTSKLVSAALNCVRSPHSHLQISAILVLAYMVLGLGAANAVQNLLQLDGGAGQALRTLLSAWVELQADMSESYLAKLNVNALAQLLALRDPRVLGLPVQGYPQVRELPPAPGGGKPRKTRSKGANAPAEVTYSRVPFGSKAISLLLMAWREELAEARIRASGGAGPFDPEATDEEEDGFNEDGGDEGFEAAVSAANARAVAGAAAFADAPDDFYDESDGKGRRRGGRNGDDGDDDDDDAEDGGGMGNGDIAIALSDFIEEEVGEWDGREADDDEEERDELFFMYPEMSTNKVNDLDVLAFVPQTLRALSQQGPQEFKQLAQALNEEDQRTLHEAMHFQGVPQVTRPPAAGSGRS
jgi:hypothetical protein